MNKPIFCPLCESQPAGPEHRYYACPTCHKQFIEESLEKINHQPRHYVAPATRYGGVAHMDRLRHSLVTIGQAVILILFGIAHKLK